MNKIRSRLIHEAFHPSWFGAIISPVYIVRRGLFKAIFDLSSTVGGHILDFGCGSKPYESLFLNATQYTGVDIEVSGHNHVDSKVDVFYDGEKLPFPDGSFDSVVSFEVFEHLFNIDKVLIEVRRVLKPGGLLLVSIPFAWEEHEAPYDFARYTSFGIEHVLRQAGFEIIRNLKSTTSFLAICQLFIAFLAKYVSPQSRYLAIAFQILIIFPLNIFSLFFNTVFPKQYGYFCNYVVLCKRST